MVCLTASTRHCLALSAPFRDASQSISSADLRIFALTRSCSRRARSPSGDDKTPPSSPSSFSARNSLSQRKPWRDGPSSDDESAMADVEEFDLSEGAPSEPASPRSQQGDECLEGTLRCACGRSGTFGLDYCDACYWQTLCWHITDPTSPARELSVSVSLAPSELSPTTKTTTSSPAQASLSSTTPSQQALALPQSSTSSTSASLGSSAASQTLSGPSAPSGGLRSSFAPLKSSMASSLAQQLSLQASVSTPSSSPIVFASRSSVQNRPSATPLLSPSLTKSSPWSTTSTEAPPTQP